jgi:hypothetical protein
MKKKKKKGKRKKKKKKQGNLGKRDFGGVFRVFGLAVIAKRVVWGHDWPGIPGEVADSGAAVVL